MNLKNMLGQFKANSRDIRQTSDRLSHERRSFRGLFNDNLSYGQKLVTA